MLATLAAWWWFRCPARGRRVVIPLRCPSDHALRGLLARERGEWLVLVDVTLVRPDRSSTPMLGDVVLHRGNVVMLGDDA
jgi:hypothetical protein